MQYLGLYFILNGVYIFLRTRSLWVQYKRSGRDKFLDYFEEDYLKTCNTWRRRYSIVYNSKIYRLLTYAFSFVATLSGIVLIFVWIYLKKGGAI